jgi:uncharacterized RDD family membrane protein YckC/predicted small metal-binding protein
MQTIEIRTTQNVMIEYELATLQQRILAFVIDVFTVWVICIGIAFIIENIASSFDLEDHFSQLFIYFFLPVWGFIFYQLASEVLANGQSWGKKIIGLKVVRLDGQEAGLSDYLLRAIFHIVDTGMSLGILAAMLVSSSPKRQRLGDMTANTTVIRAKQSIRFQLDDILGLDSLSDYEPTYRNVKNLHETDVLFIKNAIARYMEFRNEAHAEAMDELVEHLQNILEIEEIPNNRMDFLKTLIKDYIVLTR